MNSQQTGAKVICWNVMRIILIFGFLILANVGCGTTEAPAVSILDECDRLASDPLDSRRQATPVQDAELAVGKAINACEKAVNEYPHEARAYYLAARSLYVGNRFEHAADYFHVAADLGYPGAMAYLAELYWEGKGVTQDRNKAVDFARKAEQYNEHWAVQYINQKYSEENPELAAQADGVAPIDRLEFDVSMYKYPEIIGAIYNENYDALKINKANKYFSFLYIRIMNEKIGNHDFQVFMGRQECLLKLHDEDLADKLFSVKWKNFYDLITNSGSSVAEIRKSISESAKRFHDVITEGLESSGWLAKGKRYYDYLFSDDEEGKEDKFTEKVHKDAETLIKYHGCDGEITRRVMENSAKFVDMNM